MTKKEEKKNITFKQLSFNPISFFSQKYSPKKFNDNNMINIYNNNNIISSDQKEDEKDKNIIINKKIKLKPLNRNRKNINIQFIKKNDDILIPSNKITKELIDYNLANTHNTLLNYYNKNNKNLKIFSFVKTNSFIQDKNYNLTNKYFSANDSINKNYSSNINYNTINIENNNNNKNQEDNENILKRNIKIQKSFSQTGQILKRRIEKRKSQIEAYESEVIGKNVFPHNLHYFHKNFFGNSKDKKIFPKSNSIKFKNISNTSKINLSNFDESSKSGLMLNLNPYVKKIRKRKIMINKDKNAPSYKELKILSLQGYKRMKEDKKRRFNQILKNTNKEVIDLEHQLDELLEFNQQLFLKAE